MLKICTAGSKGRVGSEYMKIRSTNVHAICFHKSVSREIVIFFVGEFCWVLDVALRLPMFLTLASDLQLGGYLILSLMVCMSAYL